MMTPMVLRTPSVVSLAWALLLAVALAGCDARHAGPLKGRGSDEWSRSYTLPSDGELQIVGAAGAIDVQGGAGSTVEVRAERVVHAASDSAAMSMVPRVRIGEDIAAGKVVLRSDGLAGITIGVTIEVNFHITVPASTRLRLHAAGGDITVANVEGAVVVSATNGAIVGRALRGGVDARATNGNIAMDLVEVSKDPVDLRAVNGEISLTLPASADANLEASCTNGTTDIADLPLQLTGEQSTRRVRGRLNEGGTPVELTTTNGNIHIRPRP